MTLTENRSIGEVASEAYTEGRIVILAVLPREEGRRSLCSILERSNWTVHTTATVAEALRILKDSFVPVILCERDLPDGNWKDLLVAVTQSEQPPHLVVTSRLADNQLWAEVLTLVGSMCYPSPSTRENYFAY